MVGLSFSPPFTFKGLQNTPIHLFLKLFSIHLIDSGWQLLGGNRIFTIKDPPLPEMIFTSACNVYFVFALSHKLYLIVFFLPLNHSHLQVKFYFRLLILKLGIIVTSPWIWSQKHKNTNQEQEETCRRKLRGIYIQALERYGKVRKRDQNRRIAEIAISSSSVRVDSFQGQICSLCHLLLIIRECGKCNFYSSHPCNTGDP